MRSPLYFTSLCLWLLVGSLVGGPMSVLAEPPTEKVPLTEAEKEAIASLRKLGALVLEVAQTDSRLDISLHLVDSKVTDEQLAPLKQLPRTIQLNLRKTAITDAGLEAVKGLKQLEKLHLENTAITDAGLTHLGGLENLEYLNLYGTKVTDAGLKSLTGLKKLKRLYLWQTGVTDAGVDALKQALPGLVVNRGLDAPKAEPKPDPKPEEKK